MQKIFFFIFIALLYCCFSPKKESNDFLKEQKEVYNLNFTIKGASNRKVILYCYYGNQLIQVNSTTTNSKGKGNFAFNNKFKPGLYKLKFGSKNELVIVFNNEDIELSSFVVNSIDSLRIIKSVENSIYYDYIKHEKEFQKKLQLLFPVIQNYPKYTKYYEQSLKEYQNLINEHQRYITSLINNYPQSIAVKNIQFSQTPSPNPALSQQENIELLKTTFLAKSDFSDSSLLYSNAIPNKVKAYLSLFNINKNHTPAIEKEYIKAVNNILNRAIENEAVFESILNLLVEIFEEIKAENVLLHLNQTYLPQISCVNEELQKELESRLDKYVKVSIGKKAPDFTIPDENNNTVNLYNIKSKNTLILFWASWCPHCTKIIPEIHQYYQNNKDKSLEIIAISLDENRNDWLNYISKYSSEWKNCSELKSWESKVVRDYNIFATPTMVLLDSNKTIIAKPTSLNELKSLLE